MARILDLAIGTVFVFLLFSLIVTAANEIWLSLLDKRAAFLKEGLDELLYGNNELVGAVLNHGLISSMTRGVYDPKAPTANALKQVAIRILPSFLWRKFKFKTGTEGVPSYIPGKSFVLALISLLPKAPPAAVDEMLVRLPAPVVNEGAEPTIAARLEMARRASAELRASIETLPRSKLRGSLLALYDDAAGDLDHFKANLENWFNESMDRVGGWYKRYAQQWLFALALILAMACNVDSIRIIRALSSDPKLLESVVKQAEKYFDDKQPAAAASAAASAQASAPAPSPAQTLSPEERVQKYNEAVNRLGGTGVPIGWNDAVSQELLARLPRADRLLSGEFWAELFSMKGWFALAAWMGAFAGWLLSAFAASLGAPFWFDTLNRFVDIRGVGRAPEEKDSTAPKRRAAPAESYLKTGDSKPADREDKKKDNPTITLRVESSPSPTATPSS